MIDCSPTFTILEVALLLIVVAVVNWSSALISVFLNIIDKPINKITGIIIIKNGEVVVDNFFIVFLF